jgi:hypothetical protein
MKELDKPTFLVEETARVILGSSETANLATYVTLYKQEIKGTNMRHPACADKRMSEEVRRRHNIPGKTTDHARTSCLC